MKRSYAKISLAELCDVFGKSRQTFYDRIWLKEQRQMEIQIVSDMISEKRKNMPRIGGVKLHHLIKNDLQGHEIKLGRDKLFSLLREKDLLVKPKRRYTKTTNSYHRYHKYPNLIRNLEILRPNQVWVSDITYISIRKHFAYLSLITDIYSHKIIGFNLHKTLETIGCVEALKMAINTVLTPVESIIHHSDRGIQYCSNQYVAILNKMNIQISMTEQKDAYENAIAERVNGILKMEFGLDQSFYSQSIAQKAIVQGISVYNEMRPHMSCGFLTPEQAHNEIGKLSKKWKNYRKIKYEESRKH